MLFNQLTSAAVQWAVAEVVRTRLGAFGTVGTLLLVLVMAGVRARSLSLAGPAAVLFVLLMTQA
ncbi:hypothetical protein [Streptomyces pactum]|nr:hypothetical protein [Streptomyces pactum]